MRHIPEVYTIIFPLYLLKLHKIEFIRILIFVDTNLEQ